MQVDMLRWVDILRQYKIDNHYLFDPPTPKRSRP